MKTLKTILIIISIMGINACEQEGWSPSGEVTMHFDMRVYPGAKGLPGKINENERFDFNPCITSYNDPLIKVNFQITLPKEVKLIEGGLTWKGDMGPQQKQCLDLSLLSRTEMEQWATPIKVRAEFLHRGEKITGEQNWSADEKTRNETVWQKNNKQIRNY